MCFPLLFAIGCGQPAYRLEGRVSGEIPEVNLLDDGALELVRSLQDDYERELEDLGLNTQSRQDSLDVDLKSLQSSLAKARANYEPYWRRYRSAFDDMKRFKSFGGNPVFSEEDVNIDVKRLLEEITDRQYGGKVFSLETKGQIRNFIRSRLIPLQKQVNRSRARLARVERHISDNRKQVKRLGDSQSLLNSRLKETHAQIIGEKLQSRIIRKAQVDSNGYYRFQRIPAAHYQVYASHRLPEIWLVSVDVSAHMKLDLRPQSLRLLLQTPAD